MAAASSQYGAGGHGSPWGGSVATSPPPTPASSQYGDGRHGSPWGGSVATPPPSTRASSQYADDRHGSPWNDGVATPPVTPTYSRAPPQYRARHGSHEVATPPPGTRYSPYHYPPSAAKDPRNGEGKDAEGFGRR
ncbi:hypothetical protein B0H19DRAFT_1201428 [Mycena capillaripes]|nr:hypothetical protein B0H19DRAFT_1201428 [Mycena capillaripes]